MAITKLEPFGSELPERWRRWLDFTGESEGMIKVEEVREGSDLVVRAEVPGVDPEKDVEVSVTDSTLHISAKREERSEQREKGSYRSEFRYGEFSRNIGLPKGVDREAVKASYRDGILEVRVPWPTEEATATKIAVERG